MGVIIRNGRAYTPSQISTIDELPSVGAKNQIYLLGNDLYFWNDELSTPAFIKATLHLDNVTIKEKNGFVTGAGADVTGETFTIGGQAIVAGSGATIYNDYQTNKAVGAYSNVFGQNNISKSSYSAIFGKGNNDYSTTPSGVSANFLSGMNLVLSGNAYQNAIFGLGNTLTASTSDCNLITGSDNHISGTTVNFNFIYGSGNSTGLTTLEQSIIGGMSNHVSGQKVSQSMIIGFNNEVVGDTSSYGNIILGSSNTCTLKSNLGCLVSGDGLTFNPEVEARGRILLGRYNDPTITDSVFTIGNGGPTQTSDCVRLSSSGLLQLCGANGNAVTVNGDTIESDREGLDSIISDGASYISTYLPKNSGELLLSQLYTVASITITNISQMFYDNGRGVSTKAVSDGYNSVIIFKKDVSITSVEDILTNFTATDNTKIYLLNKDLDISTYDIIHIMLFNDGFHICAIVAGYEE